VLSKPIVLSRILIKVKATSITILHAIGYRIRKRSTAKIQNSSNKATWASPHLRYRLAQAERSDK
jgi:hypothetical protein